MTASNTNQLGAGDRVFGPGIPNGTQVSSGSGGIGTYGLNQPVTPTGPFYLGVVSAPFVEVGYDAVVNMSLTDNFMDSTGALNGFIYVNAGTAGAAPNVTLTGNTNLVTGAAISE